MFGTYTILNCELQQLFDYILPEVVSIVVVVRGGVMVDCDDNRTIIVHQRLVIGCYQGFYQGTK